VKALPPLSLVLDFISELAGLRAGQKVEKMEED